MVYTVTQTLQTNWGTYTLVYNNGTAELQPIDSIIETVVSSKIVKYTMSQKIDHLYFMITSAKVDLFLYFHHYIHKGSVEETVIKTTISPQIH